MLTEQHLTSWQVSEVNETLFRCTECEVRPHDRDKESAGIRHREWDRQGLQICEDKREEMKDWEVISPVSDNYQCVLNCFVNLKPLILQALTAYQLRSMVKYHPSSNTLISMEQWGGVHNNYRLIIGYRRIS